MRITPSLAAAAFLLAACSSQDRAAADSGVGANDSLGAGMSTGAATGTAGSVTATVRDANGRELGVLTLADGSGGIDVTGTLRGLAPGAHGIHVHMMGACEAPKFESAGGHWNPTSKQHGHDNPQGPHLGDMRTITVGADSSVAVSVRTAGGTLRGADALLDADGASVVVHANADDDRTDPSGNSGDRIACGAVSGS